MRLYVLTAFCVAASGERPLNRGRRQRNRQDVINPASVLRPGPTHLEPQKDAAENGDAEPQKNALQKNNTQKNATQKNAMQKYETQKNATQKNATQMNATQNATQSNATPKNDSQNNASKKIYPQDKGLAAAVTATNEHIYVWMTQLFPHSPRKNAPFVEAQPLVCDSNIKCDSTRLGVGRRMVVWQWIGAVVSPFVMASLIICGSSTHSHTHGKINLKTGHAFASMLVSAFCSALFAYLCYDISRHTVLQLCLIPLALICLTCSVIATFSYIDIDFGKPDFSPGVYLQTVSCFCPVCFTLMWYGAAYLVVILRFCSHNAFLNFVIIDFVEMFVLIVSALVPRNSAFLLWLLPLYKSYIYTFWAWDDTTGDALYVNECWRYPMFFTKIVFSLLCFVTPYSRDRYFVAAFGCLVMQGARVGCNHLMFVRFATLKLQEISQDKFSWLRILEVIIVSCTCCIAMQYQIVLPEQLQKVKYLRLGHFYETRSAGQILTRNQELPESAFGNPAKVVHLIIISHHWLDGHTCDVATPEFPQGLRLTTTCQRLEQFFPQQWPGFAAFCSKPFFTLSQALRSVTYSSHDVLIFFDYPSLPQIGTLPDGTLIQRTAQEQVLFDEILPAVGLLYTMFPVMVCPEVCEGVTSYSSSGWCYCEWEQAKLSGTLSPYTTIEDEFKDELDAVSQPLSLETIEEELKTKLFRCEGDRVVVQGIVKGTWIRRELLASVTNGNIDKVRAQLQQLSDHNLQHTIDFSIDPETLDTLLHVSKKLASDEIANVLLDYGADPKRPNHRGELPGYFFLFPRSWFPCLR